jgi:hypothetical protein
MNRALALAACLCSALAFAAGAETATGTETGLRGTLFVYPSQPVCPRGASCTKPAPGLTLAFFRNGMRVARSTTNRLGRYRVLLAPGAYTVKLARRPAAPMQPSRVVVPRTGIRRVDLTYDSGIR